ncbi:unnamed protein product [Lathyrus sativus]|nr:unnamed protein product [Lathyrus sativus]
MNVCIKCVGSRVCECGGDNGNGVTMWSAGSRKQQQQQQKLPKRGPGVAELEKILKEQGTNDLPATQRGNNEGFSISLSWPCPDSSVLHSHVPSLPPVIGSTYGNDMNSSLGGNGDGVQYDDSGSSPPRNLSAAMPMPWSPSVHSDGKPFFNFLEVKDQDAESSNDGIDLTLKL